MNANVSKLLNEQINKEFYSAYLYLDFANYYAAVPIVSSALSSFALDSAQPLSSTSEAASAAKSNI